MTWNLWEEAVRVEEADGGEPMGGRKEQHEHSLFFCNDMSSIRLSFSNMFSTMSLGGGIKWRRIRRNSTILC